MMLNTLVIIVPNVQSAVQASPLQRRVTISSII
jgi:hypothetical protein